MIRTFISLMLLALLAAAPADATAPAHVWSQAFGGTSDDDGNAVAADGSGNVYVTGMFQGTVNFGGSDLVSAGSRDIFLVKFNAAGNHLWSKRFGDTGWDEGYAVAVDAAGEVHLGGSFAGTVDFGGGALVSAGSADIVLAKFDASGNHLWSRRMGSTGGDHATSIALDASGNVYATGPFWDTVDFGGGPLTSAGQNDIFLIKYDASGSHAWSRSFGDTDQQTAGSVSVDASGTVFLGATFRGSVDFGGGPLVSAGDQDLALAAFDDAGAHQWSRAFGSTSQDNQIVVGADGSGGVFAAGGFQGTVDFGGGSLPNAGFIDMFLARYDANGTHLWSQSFGSASSDFVHALVVDDLGNLIVTGAFSGTLDFGGGPLMPADGHVLAMFDAGGAHQWSQNHGPGASKQSVALDGAGRISLTGRFSGTTDFGGGNLASNGPRADIFVAVFGPGATTDADDPPRSHALSLTASPNPFTASVELRFTIAQAGHASVSVHDVTGRRVRLLATGRMTPGVSATQWDARDDEGRPVAAGVYFARLRQGATGVTRRLVLGH